TKSSSTAWTRTCTALSRPAGAQAVGAVGDDGGDAAFEEPGSEIDVVDGPAADRVAALSPAGDAGRNRQHVLGMERLDAQRGGGNGVAQRPFLIFLEEQ